MFPEAYKTFVEPILPEIVTVALILISTNLWVKLDQRPRGKKFKVWHDFGSRKDFFLYAITDRSPRRAITSFFNLLPPTLLYHAPWLKPKMPDDY